MFSTANRQLGPEPGWKRHTDVLKGTPSSEAALEGTHENRDAGKEYGDDTFYQRPAGLQTTRE
jgi:hypothetical protein